jgi:peptidoglycan/xylan/chitin deacetylase (PgdA/CDA1 family)
VSFASSFKRAAAWGLLRSRALALHAAFNQRGRAILLMYHRVNDEADPFFPSMPRTVFEEQLDFLQRSYHVTGLEEAVSWLRGGAQGPPRVVLTFDDGYSDTYDVAFPALRRRRLPATLFLSTAPLETGSPLWLDRLRALMKLTPAEVFHSPRLGLGPWPLASVTDRLEALWRLRSYLKPLGAAAVEDTMTELEERLGAETVTAGIPRTLTWAQVQTMLKEGVSLGAHTHRHYIMSRLTAEEARTEVATSIDLIRRRVGVTVTAFAYPNGASEDYTPGTRALLAELGMTCVCTTIFGFAGPNDDPLELPRLHTTADTLGLFACRVAGLNGFLRDAPMPMPPSLSAAERQAP